MSPQELSALQGWASDLCHAPGSPMLISITAGSLWHVLDLRGRTSSPHVRALLDLRIALLLDDLAEAGLKPA